jgi:hypothetical protein
MLVRFHRAGMAGTNSVNTTRVFPDNCTSPVVIAVSEKNLFAE